MLLIIYNFRTHGCHNSTQTCRLFIIRYRYKTRLFINSVDRHKSNIKKSLGHNNVTDYNYCIRYHQRPYITSCIYHHRTLGSLINLRRIISEKGPICMRLTVEIWLNCCLSEPKELSVLSPCRAGRMSTFIPRRNSCLHVSIFGKSVRLQTLWNHRLKVSFDLQKGLFVKFLKLERFVLWSHWLGSLSLDCQEFVDKIFEIRTLFPGTVSSAFANLHWLM